MPAQQVQPLHSETMVGAGGCPSKRMLGHTQLCAQDWGGMRGSTLTLRGCDQCRAYVVFVSKGTSPTKAIPQQATRHCTKKLPGMSRRD